ncbi:MAG: sulfotransferase [Micromonosporaceae bacterium]|nr:sulfotransferase [Micromonosporaceae bacterium]
MEPPDTGRWIIISNGRCGSTLLSDLIAEQQDTLSVQEFSVSLPWARAEEQMTAAQFWQLLARPKYEMATLFRIGLPPKEVRYPATGRWASRLTELPWVLAITLSKLDSDPDALFDRLATVVAQFPVQTLAAHTQMFLDRLAAITGRRRWVERSGGSSRFAAELMRAFPTARVVYLTRNWEDTARSMSRHPSFQLVQLRVEFLGRCGLDPFKLQPGQQVPEDLRAYLPDRLTAESLRERGRDTGRYLSLCAFLTNQAEQALADMPARQLLRMSYEDLVAEPVEQLGRLGRFLEFDDWAGWAAQVAGRVVARDRTPVEVVA